MPLRRKVDQREPEQRTSIQIERGLTLLDKQLVDPDLLRLGVERAPIDLPPGRLARVGDDLEWKLHAHLPPEGRPEDLVAAYHFLDGRPKKLSPEIALDQKPTSG